MKRRDTLQILGLAAIAGASLPAFATVERRPDARLLGTWRSDKERTITHWCQAKGASSENRRRVEGIFGKLTVRFTETHIESQVDGRTDSVPYSVVASDASSVIVEFRGALGNAEIQQIHFEDEHYYILVGYNVEFFKRIDA